MGSLAPSSSPGCNEQHPAAGQGGCLCMRSHYARHRGATHTKRAAGSPGAVPGTGGRGSALPRRPAHTTVSKTWNASAAAEGQLSIPWSPT